jgi:rubrerythrin
MADPVTDSRQPGFNPEVEESKAAEAEAAKNAAAEARGERQGRDAGPKYTHRCTACGGLHLSDAVPCPHCGAGYELQKL